MTVFKVRIEIENDAFVPDPKPGLSNVLGEMAACIASDCVDGTIRDRNGNRIGGWAIVEEPQT